ncbi:hypothetical protein MPSEU_000517500 [Mayamaea pseudoterrestris]|nr:hypothetical protein MPSEU_000517500 [Mayamaea pseudoterrestris]
MEGVPLPPGIPGYGGSTDPLEAILGPFPCARLRNLFFDASVEDILHLFQGLLVIDVLLIGHGEAFVIFANPMDFQMALQRNGQSMRRTFVDITPSSRGDYYEAVANQQHHEQEHERRPDYSAGATLADERSADGQRSSGSAADVNSLWGSSHEDIRGSSPFSGRFGGGSMSSKGQVTLAVNRGHRGSGAIAFHAPPQKRVGGGIQIGEHTGFLRMRGLPFAATKDDVIDFFRAYNPIPESVVITYRNDGRPTGEAYIGFMNSDEAQRAMELHRRSMGSRYIELFISNQDEQSRALARFGSH